MCKFLFFCVKYILLISKILWRSLKSFFTFPSLVLSHLRIWRGFCINLCEFCHLDLD